LNPTLNTWTWVIWLSSTLVVIWSTRNPIYLGLILLTLICVWLSAATRINKQYPDSRSTIPFSPVRISVFIIFFSAIFNGLISRFGNTPLFYLPEWIPFLGGPVTLEGLAFGVINGMVLSGILIAFMTVNLTLPARSLIRLIPRAFYPLAVVTSIAVTFLPNTTRQVDEIRESQAIRGHRVRGLKDWLPLIMPLLIGGLERAMGLAETMTARGFAGDEGKPLWTRSRVGLVFGLLFLLTGWLFQLIPALQVVGIITSSFGLCLIFYTLWTVGKRVQRSHYRRETWTYLDMFVIIGCALILSIYLLPFLWLDKSSIAYNPYPIITLPQFDILIALASFMLVIPAIKKSNSNSDLHNQIRSDD